MRNLTLICTLALITASSCSKTKTGTNGSDAVYQAWDSLYYYHRTYPSYLKYDSTHYPYSRDFTVHVDAEAGTASIGSYTFTKQSEDYVLAGFMGIDFADVSILKVTADSLVLRHIALQTTSQKTAEIRAYRKH